MKRIRITESELVNLIKRVINEQNTPCKQINGSPCSPNSMSLMTPMNTCVTINGVPANNSHVGQVVVHPGNNNPFEITNVTNITATAVQPTTTVDFTTTNQPCNTTNTGGCAPYQMCQKDCSQLVPSSFYTLIANKPCNWLTNRMAAFQNKMNNMTDKCNCQYKRVSCKSMEVKELIIQNGC